MSAQNNNKSHQERLMREAIDIVHGSRRDAYGPPERNFWRIASLWSAYLAVASDAHPDQQGLTALNVCHMLDLVKLARLVETPDHEDSLRDRFGYNCCNVDLVYGNSAEPVVVKVDATPDEWQAWPPAVEPVVADHPFTVDGVPADHGNEPVWDKPANQRGSAFPVVDPDPVVDRWNRALRAKSSGA